VKGTNPERAAARRLARRRELQELACAEDELSLLEVCARGHCNCLIFKSVTASQCQYLLSGRHLHALALLSCAAARSAGARRSRAPGAQAIAEAEEEYAEQDDGFWANSGVPIEPFHLRSERAGGYFDAEVRTRADPTRSLTRTQPTRLRGSYPLAHADPAHSLTRTIPTRSVKPYPCARGQHAVCGACRAR
jgi:hypothetical protein